MVCNLYDEKNYVVHVRILKQVLDHGLIFKKMHKVIILRTKAKNDFEKDFFKLMNDSVFRKIMENVRKHRDIKLVTTDKRRNQLVSEPNYYTTK